MRKTIKRQKQRITINKRELLFFLAGALFILCFPLRQSAASDVQISSRSAVVMDAATGRVLYAKNPQLHLKPASTAKLMTALVVVEKAKLSDIVTVSRRAAQSAPTRAGFREGDKATVGMLLNAALIKSANDAAVALAESVAGSVENFVSLMNRKAAALGINDTRFINPNGLPGKGQYITAYDLAIIMRQAIKYPVLRKILGTRVAEVSTENGKTMFIKNTNKLLWSDDEILAGKTGYTRKARHCYVGAGERDDRTVIVALLGTPKRASLWKETEELMDFGYKVLDRIEEPVVYLTRADYASTKAVRASYTKKAGTARYIKPKLKRERKKPIYR